MRVVVSPLQAAVLPGQAQPITITITNTATVIGGYAVRILGADPGWITLETDQVSLFPDETRTLTGSVTAPPGIPAGSRRIAIQVRELTPPEASSITEIDLSVPAAKSVQVRADPLAVTAGKRATFSLIVENTGNTVVTGQLAGDDAEDKVRFTFEPDHVQLAPGEHSVIDMRARSRRPVTGSPAVRLLGIYLDDRPPDPFFEPGPPTPAARGERDALANATFIQKAVLTRGPLSLLGLLAAVTVFAVVLVIALSRLVGQTAADRDLALQVAAARNGSATTGTSGVAGTVRQLTSGKAVSEVAVSVYAAADTTTPIATTATNASGAYTVGNLAAGKYKISFEGAGFLQLWYPGATTDADATTITLPADHQQTGLDVRLGGIPASISGTVVGDDVSAATLYLESTLDNGTSTTADATSGGAAAIPGTAPAPNDGNSVVKTVPIGSDGTFSLAGVPSPAIYELVVTKTGYATSTQRIDIGAGENRSGVQLTLTKGDGLISGTVSSSAGPLAQVTITATSGQNTASTVSLTGGTPGAFTLRGLPTPATFTVTASKAGYTTQTMTLTLASGQKLTGVAITLGTSSGTLRGVVTQTPGNTAAGGVTVTVTDGLLSIQTVTESESGANTGHVGDWQVGGLAVPGTYTVTFARPDLASQTVAVTLDAAGTITIGSQSAGRVTASSIAVTMQSATATVYGRITQSGASGCAGTRLGEASVSLNSGAASYTVVSASVPQADCGQYRIEQVPPGTYTLTVSAGTGTSSMSQVITLRAGDLLDKNVNLARPASMTGTLTQGDQSLTNWTVFLYLDTDYPDTVSRTTTTAAGGTFRFDDIPAGSYIVAVGPTSDAANAVDTQHVTVQPSQNKSVTIEVPQ